MILQRRTSEDQPIPKILLEPGFVVVGGGVPRRNVRRHSEPDSSTLFRELQEIAQEALGSRNPSQP